MMTTTFRIDHNSAAGGGRYTPISNAVERLLNIFNNWERRANKRRELRDLLSKEGRIFKDIDVLRQDVVQEAFKPFWRA